jgi:hypothetical protein
MKIIKDCSKEGPNSFPRGNIHRKAKIRLDQFKTFFSRMTEPEELIFT